MKSIRFLERRTVSSVLALAMLLGIASPALVPLSVSADQISARSIQMSTTTASATAVKYKVTFTPVTTVDTVVVEFCGNSPVLTESCTAPAGFTSASAASDRGTAVVGFSGATNSTRVTDATTHFTGGNPETVELSGITNPNNTVTSFYARIITYPNSATAGTQHSAISTYGTYTDAGGVALSVTEPIQVSAIIRETLTFCVRKTAPTAGCTGGGSPTVALGHGTPAALDATATNTDTVNAQLSTNAISGAVVRMKNSNSCGGLHRIGAVSTSCEIPAVTTGTSTIPLGTAKFGMAVGTASNATGGSTPTGTLASVGNYTGAGSTYGMDYTASSTTNGVSSDYGDPIFNSSGAPVSNKNIGLTFAATASPDTPAGTYTADMSLIATGTF
jgi:hypothetical protein